ncbi:methyl-accepting chemotaxis protein [Fluviispira sanaruensis]|uniref:Methyl-accepting chemotaxis protein n=1 Tax=Fluviispira sanaruensis TaxID=2493639 RepID=A0A4P2VKL8_FLUSA|nr:methyl-accepting chemotaxis protein [Fluviispira sanaruensis]BBH53853.1 methyl-accepting chemotaxis protein [Fluviispira sanaruensis]
MYILSFISLKKFNSLNLQTRIILVCLGLLSIIAVFTIGLNFISWFQAKKDLIEKQIVLQSSASQLIAGRFVGRYNEVKSFATNPIYETMNENSISHVLNQYRNFQDIYDLILFVDKKGRYVASNNLGMSGARINQEVLKEKTYENEEWFTHVMEGKTSDDSERNFYGTYVEDIQIDIISSLAYGIRKLGNSFSTAVKNSRGEIIGVLSVRANLVWMEAEIQSAFESIRKESVAEMAILVINNKGQIVVNYDPHSRGGSIEIVRDFKEILKLNIANYDYEPAKKLIEKKEGMGVFSNPWHEKKNDIAVYSLLKSKQILPTLGWGVITRILEEEAYKSVNESFLNTIIIIIFIFIVSFISLFLIAYSLGKKFIYVSETLGESAALSEQTSLELDKSCSEVKKMTLEQSHSVNQTAAAMAEITSMITRTGELINESKGISDKANEKSAEGTILMDKMAEAISAIKSTNAELEKMEHVISIIINKASTINDIVAKTELLSLNASIESARAGEYGKGFSVVSEEVDSLAKISGNAAKDISVLLNDSHMKVSQIIKITHERVNEGLQVSQRAVESFQRISHGITEIRDRTNGIFDGTNDQKVTVQSSGLSMDIMSNSVHKNSKEAEETSKIANEMRKQSKELFNVSFEIQNLILGEGQRQINIAQMKNKEILRIIGKIN